ncbi:MAG: ParB/RepB/Spo0J family partition protein [Elusimicrobiales bacterium]
MPRQEESIRRGSLNLLGIEAAGIPAVERIIEIPVSAIRPNPHQPRRQFPQESLQELAGSIKAHGLQQPVIVRQVKQTDHGGAAPVYQLVAGERRLRAHELAGLKVIRAIVRATADEQLLRLSIVENIHREDLPFMDRALAFCRFKDQFHAGKVEAAAEDLKISRRTGFNYSKIGSAEPDFQKLIVKNDLDVRSSNLLLNLADKVAKELPKKTEAFKKAVHTGELGFPALNTLQAKYFPASVKEDTRPAAAAVKTAHTSGAAAIKTDPFRKTETEVVLELRFHPGKKPDTKLRAQWAKAAKQFFKAAGFTTVELED